MNKCVAMKKSIKHASTLRIGRSLLFPISLFHTRTQTTMHACVRLFPLFSSSHSLFNCRATDNFFYCRLVGWSSAEKRFEILKKKQQKIVNLNNWLSWMREIFTKIYLFTTRALNQPMSVAHSIHFIKKNTTFFLIFLAQSFFMCIFRHTIFHFY